MKYIKEYHQIEQIEILSEYLQELFDKYSIPKSDPKYLSIGDNLPENSYYYISDDILVIQLSDHDRLIIRIIKKDLEKIYKTIESRIGHQIKISYDEGYNQIIVFLK
jgi:hypothetical protein